MITTEEAESITTLPKRSQGPAIDKALESLLQNGRNHKEAFAELAEATGMQPNTIAQGFYRRKRQKGEGRPLVRVRSDSDPRNFQQSSTPEVARATDKRSVNGRVHSLHQALLKAQLDYVNALVEQRTAERLAEARKALDSR